MMTAIRSGTLIVDGERYELHAGVTGWADCLVTEVEQNAPDVREFFPVPLEEVLGEITAPPEARVLRAAYELLDAARELRALGATPDLEEWRNALWTLLEPVVYPLEEDMCL